jgi:4-hydroxythreonine-4-phosphate dehydrogenase
MRKPLICITMGDPAGIGAEIIVKTLTREQIYTVATPVVIGCGTVLKDALSFIPSNLKLHRISEPSEARAEPGWIDVVDLGNIGLDDFRYGEIGAEAGRASVEYIFGAIDLAMKREVDAVVTGPIHKEAIAAAGFDYSGHTEIFAEKTGTENYAMMLADGPMRVIHVTTHVSLRKACDLVNKDRVLAVIRLAYHTMQDLEIDNPRIGVAGLNPHAGEHGLFGDEEMTEIVPAIERARAEGISAEGPVPSDTLFSKMKGSQYDIAVVMYHDQGHIPMKFHGFVYEESNNRWTTLHGVNVTLGLPIIRTSVDHGVAFGKAGEGRANEGSMVEAVEMAVKLAKKRI